MNKRQQLELIIKQNTQLESKVRRLEHGIRDAVRNAEAKIRTFEAKIQETTAKIREVEDSVRKKRVELHELQTVLADSRDVETKLRTQVPARPGLFERVKGPGRPAGGERTLQGRDRTFWASVHKQDDGCWLWLRGSKLFPHRGESTVKRVAWLLVRGISAPGRLDGTCRTPDCINPDHQRV